MILQFAHDYAWLADDAFNEKALGHVVALAILLSLAMELALKAILLRRSCPFKRTHDLVYLYESMDWETQKIVAFFYGSEKEPSIEVILEKHNSSFKDWRYPSDGKLQMGVENLSKVLCKFHTAYRHM